MFDADCFDNGVMGRIHWFQLPWKCTPILLPLFTLHLITGPDNLQPYQYQHCLKGRVPQAHHLNAA